jgi:hypothetical protein
MPRNVLQCPVTAQQQKVTMTLQASNGPPQCCYMPKQSTFMTTSSNIPDITHSRAGRISRDWLPAACGGLLLLLLLLL